MRRRKTSMHLVAAQAIWHKDRETVVARFIAIRGLYKAHRRQGR